MFDFKQLLDVGINEDTKNNASVRASISRMRYHIGVRTKKVLTQGILAECDELEKLGVFELVEGR